MTQVNDENHAKQRIKMGCHEDTSDDVGLRSLVIQKRFQKKSDTYIEARVAHHNPRPI